MRQAGRCLPEYRALRERHSLWEICRTPALAVEATLQPVRRFDVDVAVLFSDLGLPLAPMGLDIERAADPGASPPPRVEDLERLAVFDPREKLLFVLETIRLVRAELNDHRPVLGLAGGPFTLACHVMGEAAGDGFTRTRSLMYAEPAVWHDLCRKLVHVSAEFVRAQVEAGIDAVQVFDSWIGTLSAADYEEFVLPHARDLFDRIARLSIPAIHFGLGTAHLAELIRDAGGDVIGIDWRVPLDEAWTRIGADRAIQGNLDPTLLLGPTERLLSGAADVLDRAAGRPGHIFNLGHGLLPATAPDRIQALTRYVHSYSLRRGGERR
jgi:uroporphyrinogen decarboxylase